jgi:hypothetical protein
MSVGSMRPNTWVVVSPDANTQLSYAPQVDPSPLTVGSSGASLEIVITNPTDLDIEVHFVEFTIKVSGDEKSPPYPDSTALTTTTANMNAMASDANWTVEQLDGSVTHGNARYKLKPSVGESLKIAKGASVVAQIYGFPANIVSGTSTIQIKEATANGIAFPSFTVTTFPWGFVFSDLAACVPDGSDWKPIAQVEREQRVTLFWHGSVLEPGAYKIYYSGSQGQKECTPKNAGQWLSDPLTADTVFTLVVTTTDSVGIKLTASLSVGVGVSHPDLVANSLTVQDKVGIGTTAPGSPLSFSNDLGEKISLWPQTAGCYGFGIQSALLQIHTDTDQADIAFGSGSSSNFKETMRITGGGRVGIGASNPDFPLSFSNDLGDKISLYSGQAGSSIGFSVQSYLLQIHTDTPATNIAFGSGSSSNFKETMRITGDGNLQLGGNMQLNGSMLLNASDHAMLFNLGYNADFTPPKTTSNAQISNDVNTFKCLMLVGNASQGAGWSDRWVGVWDSLNVAKDLYVGNNTWKQIDGDWRAMNVGDRYAWAYWSDLRLKSDVQTVPSALDKVRQLRGVTFHWNENAIRHFTRDIETTVSAGPGATREQHQECWRKERERLHSKYVTSQIGIVAQDVEAILPEAVTTDADGYKSVRYDNLIPLLIEAIKEQDRLVAQQQAEIESLKLAVGIGEPPTPRRA